MTITLVILIVYALLVLKGLLVLLVLKGLLVLLGLKGLKVSKVFKEKLGLLGLR